MCDLGHLSPSLPPSKGGCENKTEEEDMIMYAALGPQQGGKTSINI